MIIEIRENKVFVTGPLENKELCLTMLNSATAVVKGFIAPVIAEPNMVEVELINNLKPA